MSRVFESFLVQPLGFVRKTNFLSDIAAVVELYVKSCSQDERVDIQQDNLEPGLLHGLQQRLAGGEALYVRVNPLFLKRRLRQDERGDYIEFQTRSGLLTLKSRQIRYIEGSRNYQLLYLEGQSSALPEVKHCMSV